MQGWRGGGGYHLNVGRGVDEADAATATATASAVGDRTSQ